MTKTNIMILTSEMQDLVLKLFRKDPQVFQKKNLSDLPSMELIKVIH